MTTFTGELRSCDRDYDGPKAYNIYYLALYRINSPSPGRRQFLFNDASKKLYQGKGDLLNHSSHSVKSVTSYVFVSIPGLFLI